MARRPIDEKTLIRAKRKNLPLNNLKPTESTLTQEAFIFTAPGISYPPNDWGIYNLIGNVTELIAEEGITKGGSWVSPVSTTWQSDFKDDSPNAHTGFRCVCEVMVP